MLPIHFQTATDSLSAALGAQIGALAAAKIALVLGAVAKVVTSGVSKVADVVTGFENKIPAAYSNWVKAGLAWVFAQLVVVANRTLAAHGVPLLPADPGALSPWIMGLVTWVVSMGIHHFTSSTVIPTVTGSGTAAVTAPPAAK